MDAIAGPEADACQLAAEYLRAEIMLPRDMRAGYHRTRKTVGASPLCPGI